MKKIFLLVAVFSMIFTSCEPLEDINKIVDIEQSINGVVSDVEYTLIEDDYTQELELDNTYFTAIQDAKDLIPSLLTSKYPVLGVKYKDGEIELASSALVTFNYNNPVGKTSYTVSNDDYTAIGLTSLNSEDDYSELLTYKFPNVEKGSIVDLTFKANPIITDYELTNADYALVGNGRFNNFDIRSGNEDELEETRRGKIQTILLNNFSDAVVGDKYEVTYKAYSGSLETLTMLVELTENAPANVTDYTLVDADYALVGNGRFNNFDIRVGNGEETIEARRAKIETILLNNVPAAMTGDVYNVTYDIYNGANETRDMLVEFDGANWNLYSALTYDIYTLVLIDQTKRFVLVNDWQAPFTLELADYQEMGQQYDNFSGRNEEQKAESNRLIEIFLGNKYPYAANDDFMAVEYQSYEGSGVTVTENVNFIFDGTKWNYVPDTTEESIKFGHDGITWVPDNTIKYSLAAADYALVGNGRYNNFDVRSGKDEETVEARLAKINTILLNNFPNDAEGQKYVVSYDVYDGANKVFTMKVVKTGGAYVLQ